MRDDLVPGARFPHLELPDHAGAFAAFSAGSHEEAAWLARQNPWRRIAPGRVRLLPSGVFERQPAPPGRGTQRSEYFMCGHPDSASEPYPDS